MHSDFLEHPRLSPQLGFLRLFPFLGLLLLQVLLHRVNSLGPLDRDAPQGRAQLSFVGIHQHHVGMINVADPVSVAGL